MDRKTPLIILRRLIGIIFCSMIGILAVGVSAFFAISEHRQRMMYFVGMAIGFIVLSAHEFFDQKARLK